MKSFAQASFAFVVLSLAVVAQQVDDAKRQIDALAPSCNANARLFIRAAFHDAGTFDKNSQSGGLDGSIRFELDRGENTGLSDIVNSLVSIAQRTKISVADAVAYSGVRAFSVCGGGNLDMKFGRRDASQANTGGRLPNPHIDAQGTINMFVTRMGFTAEETVALIGGGHSTARIHDQFHNEAWAKDGFLDDTETVIDNIIFSRILSGRGLIVPADGNMLGSSQLRAIITDLSRDNAKFLQLYRQAFQKMLDLGQSTTPSPPPPTPSPPTPTPPTPSPPASTPTPSSPPSTPAVDSGSGSSNITTSDSSSNSTTTEPTAKNSNKRNDAVVLQTTATLVLLSFLSCLI